MTTQFLVAILAEKTFANISGSEWRTTFTNMSKSVKGELGKAMILYLLLVVLREKGSARDWELRTVFSLCRRGRLNSSVISAFADSNPLLNEGLKKPQGYHGQNPKARKLTCANILANMWLGEIVEIRLGHKDTFRFYFFPGQLLNKQTSN